MCIFTLAEFTDCPHTGILMAPQNTLLCTEALDWHLVQGIDAAPAYCHPLPYNEEPNTMHQMIFGHCSECETAVIEKLDAEKQALLYSREAAKQKEYALDACSYGQEEVEEVSRIRKHLQEVLEGATEAAQSIESILTSKPNILAAIPNTDLRTLLADPGSRKFNVLWLDALTKCNTLLQCLDMQMQQRVPRRVFDDLARFVCTKINYASGNCTMVESLVDILNREDDGSGEKCQETIEFLCEEITEWMRVDQGGVPKAPDEHLSFDNPELPQDTVEKHEVKTPAPFLAEHTPPTTNSRTCSSTSQTQPFRRNAFTTPPGMSTAPHGSKLSAAILAARRLALTLETGLLPEEPATNISIEHCPVSSRNGPSDSEDVGMTFAVPDSDCDSDEEDVDMTFAVPDPDSDSDSGVQIRTPGLVDLELGSRLWLD